MSDGKDEIARIQAAIEAADSSLVQALDERARAVRLYLELRERNPEEYLSLSRDEEIIKRAEQLAKSFPLAAIEPVMREVLSASAAIVAKVQVVYFGPEGGLAHLAARKHFGASAELRAIEGVQALVDEVARGRAMCGVIPLESSSDGAVAATLDALAGSDVKIGGELTLPLRYDLFSKTGNATDVEKIYATPQAIAACASFLRTQFPRAMVVDVPSAVVGAQLASEDHGAACVATQAITSSSPSSLVSVRQSVQDQAGVEVRFAVIGNQLPPRTGTDRTVLALAVHDKPGALLKALAPFAERSVNLTRLESRPALGSAWRYIFFVELDGHVTDRPILTAIEELRSVARFVKVLGSYPRPS